ncbi:MAG: zf-HC2 domain-containing protein [Pseudomonadota bacterium]
MRKDSCRRFEPLLGELLDGELDAKTADTVYRHAAICARCAAKLAATRRLVEAARSLQSPEPPPLLWARIATRLADELPQKERVTAKPRRDRRRACWWRPRWWWRWQAMPLVQRSWKWQAKAAPVLFGATAVVIALLWLVDSGQLLLQPAGGAQMSQVLATPSGYAASARPTSFVSANSAVSIVSTVSTISTGSTVSAGSSLPDADLRDAVFSGVRGRAWPGGTGEHGFVQADADFAETISELGRLVEKERHRLPGSVLVEYESNLAAVERTVREKEEQVRRHPEDYGFRDELYGTYRRKMAVLQEVLVSGGSFR